MVRGVRSFNVPLIFQLLDDRAQFSDVLSLVSTRRKHVMSIISGNSRVGLCSFSATDRA